MNDQPVLDALENAKRELQAALRGVRDEHRAQHEETRVNLNRINDRLDALERVDKHTANEVQEIRKRVRELEDAMGALKREMHDGDRDAARALESAAHIHKEAMEALDGRTRERDEEQAKKYDEINAGIAGLFSKVGAVRTDWRTKMLVGIAIAVGVAAAKILTTLLKI
jgi:chromosome segregation ATPase